MTKPYVRGELDHDRASTPDVPITQPDRGHRERVLVDNLVLEVWCRVHTCQYGFRNAAACSATRPITYRLHQERPCVDATAKPSAGVKALRIVSSPTAIG